MNGTSVICLLAAAGCGVASAREAPREAPQEKPREAPQEKPQERFERDMLIRFHMHQSYDLVRAIERLLLRGNLEDARAFARAISEAPDELSLGPWAKQAVLVRERAAALASATTLPEAFAREARLAEACGACHADTGAIIELRIPGSPPPDRPTLDARMTRHVWAAGRLWEGIIAGAPDSWHAGLDVLAATPLPEVQAARADLGKRLQQLAEQARRRRRTDTAADRTRAYGEILATCAGCHTRAGASPGERGGAP